MTNTNTVTEQDIEQLMEEAAHHGDGETVELCGEALESVGGKSWRACAQIIINNRSNQED